MSKTFFRSESAEVKCRVCCKTLLQKNYKDHLKAKHPEDNHTDTTPFGQAKLSNSYFNVTAKKRSSCSSSSIDKESTESESQELAEIPPKTHKIHADEDEEYEYPQSHTALENKKTTPYSTMELQDDENAEEIEKENEKSKLDMILEKLSHIPSSNNHIVLGKLEEIQNQLTELSIQNETKVGDAGKRPHTATDYTENIKDVGSQNAIRSLKDLQDLGFTYESNSSESELTCVVCHDPNKANTVTGNRTLTKDQGVFSYPNDLENNFQDREFLPKEFTNLKKSIKRHLTDSITHKKNVNAEEERKAERSLFEKKNKKAGMNLGRLCIKLYLKGRPYTDYETDVLVQKINGSIVGELNHSRKFPAAFRPFVSKAVARRVRAFIGRRLPQTGHLPAVNITADKATYKHNTRQFLSCVSVVSGAEELIQVISFGHPIVKGHKGVELTMNIKEGLDKFNLQSCQIEGGSFDGQYFHLGVEKALESPAIYDLPPKNILWAWDALHKSGLVDTHLCKEERFQWLVDDTDFVLPAV